MLPNSVEAAYISLAHYILTFVGFRPWEIACCEMKIFSKLASGSQWLICNGSRIYEGSFGDNRKAAWDGLDAAIFLRDNLLTTTGQRIWGLTFTLYPDGKFNIEYDYNKPEGYEETDETISAADALNDLQTMSSKDTDKKS